jgi:endonuclease/exonuclease/phosphatase family metal-dependent hydrolase
MNKVLAINGSYRDDGITDQAVEAMAQALASTGAEVEVALLLTRTHLCQPIDRLNTFPSWRPVRNIDHILTSPSLRISEVRTLHHAFSDHLPIAVDIRVPEGVQLAA